MSFFIADENHAGLAKAVLPAIVLFSSYLLHRSYIEGDGGSIATKKKQGASLPPKAGVRMVEMVNQFSGTELPAFLLRVGKQLQAYTFQLPLPVPGYPCVIAVGDYEIARLMLKDPKTTRAMILWQPFAGAMGGHSMLTLDGPEWKHRRQHSSPAFASKHVKRMKAVAAEKVTELINNKIKPLADSGESFDIAKTMNGLMISVICKAAFEYDIDEAETDIFISELRLVLREFFTKTFSNPLRALFGPFFSERRRAHQAVQNILTICRKIIAHHRTLETPIEGTVMHLISKNPNYKDEHELAIDVFLFVAAGYDTSAYSMAFTLKELSKDTKLQQEIRDQLTTIATSSAQDWQASLLLNYALKESMRLHPVGATGPGSRVVGSDINTKLSNGKQVFVPKGSLAIMSIMSIHRNPNVFEDADAFKPLRWENPTEEMKQSWLPFVIGRQNCVGQSLANAVMPEILGRLLSEFEFNIEEEGSVEFSLSYKPVDTLLTVKRYNGSFDETSCT